MAKDEKTILDTDETVLDAEAVDATSPDDAATMPDDATALDGEAISNDGSCAPIIEKGASLLDTYHIESDAIEGGMGAVWRVHHTGWNVDLAMKRPKSSLFQSEKQKENFVHECEAWINLGLHPYIVSCYYVREINNVPSIFSEWMDGGSLKNAIEDERLYEGNAAERILDIAIQFARGLHYAHEQGLIHQDVKPDNLLLTKNWDAKVADFGIARARATLTVLDADIPTDATIFSASGGYTPAYCSMEQMNGGQLTRRTDIYSWAVSVMEMYLGERPWQNGVIAGAACEEYFPDAKVPIPQKMQELLRKCLNAKETERPHDFAEIEKRLLEIYREETGKDYLRPVSKAAADTADSLNNRALSYIDLGKTDDAEKLWEKALNADPNHINAIANQSLWSWRNGKCDDLSAIRAVELAKGNKSDNELEEFWNDFHRERGCASGTREACESPGIFPQWMLPLHFSNESSLVHPVKAGVFLTKRGGVLCAQTSAIEIWDVHTCKSICTSRVIDTLYKNFSVDNNEQYFYMPTGYRLLKVSLDSLEKTAELKGDSQEYSFVCCLPDERNLALSCGAFRGVLKVIDCVSMTILHEHTLKRVNHPLSLCTSADGKLAALLDEGGIVYIIDGATFAVVVTLDMSQYELNSVCFMPDGKRLFACGRDMRPLLIEIQNGEVLMKFAVCHDRIHHLAVSPDGRWTATCGYERAIKLWDVNRGKCVRSFEHFGSPFNVLTFSADSKRLLVGGNDNVPFIIQIPMERPAASYMLNKIASTEDAKNAEDSFLTLVMASRVAYENEDINSALAHLKAARSISGFYNDPRGMELNRKIGRLCRRIGIDFISEIDTFDGCMPCYLDSSFAFFTVGKENLALININNRKIEKRIFVNADERKDPRNNAEHATITALCCTSDGRYVFTGNAFTTIRVWDMQSSRMVGKLKGHGDGITSLSVSADNRKLISTSNDRTIRIWDISSSKCIAVLGDPERDAVHAHHRGVNAASMSCDGSRIVSCSADCTVKVWDAVTASCIGTLRGHEKDVLAVAISDDTQIALSCSADQTAILWDIKTMSLLHRFDLPGGYHYSVVFSPDGRFAFIGSTNKSFTVLDLKALKVCCSIDEESAYRKAVALSPDGDTMLRSIVNGNTKRYAVSWHYEFPGFTDWDEGARLYLNTFLTLYPHWGQKELDTLIEELQARGYGFIRPEGIRKKLMEIASTREPEKKNFSLFGKKKWR
ncbi:MAG TPA: protein kinase [Clostridiales bacterium]|nr:protein kinase [Clostridiales bacterium]